MYTFKITYIFIIYNLNTFFSYISVHSTLFNLWFFFLYWCYIASLLCYSYACLYYHACLHYVNKKWSDKDTDCTCCVYCILKCILKCLHSWNHKNLSFPWIYDMFNFFYFEFLCRYTVNSPFFLTGLRNSVRVFHIAGNHQALHSWVKLTWWRLKISNIFNVMQEVHSEDIYLFVHATH